MKSPIDEILESENPDYETVCAMLRKAVEQRNSWLMQVEYVDGDEAYIEMANAELLAIARGESES